MSEKMQNVPVETDDQKPPQTIDDLLQKNTYSLVLESTIQNSMHSMQGIKKCIQELISGGLCTEEIINNLSESLGAVQFLLGGEITKNQQNKEAFSRELDKQYFTQVDQKIPDLIQSMQAYIDADDRTLQKEPDVKIREIYAILKPLDEIQAELPAEIQEMLASLLNGIRNGTDHLAWGYSTENAQKAIESLREYLKMRGKEINQ